MTALVRLERAQHEPVSGAGLHLERRDGQVSSRSGDRRLVPEGSEERKQEKIGGPLNYSLQVLTSHEFGRDCFGDEPGTAWVRVPVPWHAPVRVEFDEHVC